MAGAATARDLSPSPDPRRRAGVQVTPELARILGLPRRDWALLSGEGYLERLSAHLRLPHSRALLRPAQVATLTEAHDLGGALGQLGMGAGKTLITGLVPTILGAKRPLLLAPAKLRKKTSRDFWRYRQDWRIHPRIEFVSYTQLGLMRYAELLEEIQPDLIVADECHRLKNLDSSCTRRVSRYMRRHPETGFVGLSGTITKRSLHDYWHLLYWALKPSRMPLPAPRKEVEQWANAVDERVDGERRVSPGALVDLAPEVDPGGELEPTTRARLALQSRLRATPGFVVTPDTSVGASLQLELVRPPKSAAIETALKELRQTWTTPNGDALRQPMEVWAQARQLACGFFYAWDPPAPPSWLDARRHYARYVRHVLSQSNSIDSPMQVQRQIEGGVLREPFAIEVPDQPGKYLMRTPQQLLGAWQEQRPLFRPRPRAQWIDDAPLRWLVQHHIAGKEPALIWVEHVAVGERLAGLARLPFCNSNAMDAQGRFIEDLAGGSVVCSVQSCGEGVNLQHAWSRNIVVSCPPNGVTVEQLIGRTHRDGQRADSVDILWFTACTEHEEGLEQAIRDARYAYETTGQMQRLLLVDRV